MFTELISTFPHLIPTVSTEDQTPQDEKYMEV